jgi:hypothetical protein
MTVNAVTTDSGTFSGGLSYQYTGISGLTENPAATVGNDWKLPEQLISAEIRDNILNLVNMVGDSLKENYAFKGFFGLDIVVEYGSDQIYLIEVNPRQIASVPMHTKLQLTAGQLPLAAINLAAFLDIDLNEFIKISPEDYSRMALEPLNGSQLLLRSEREFTVPKSNLQSGIYRQQSDVTAKFKYDEEENPIIYLDEAKDRPLIWQNHGYSLEQVEGGGFVLLIKPEGYELSSTDEIARIQIANSLGKVGDDSNVSIKPIARDTMKRIKQILHE